MQPLLSLPFRVALYARVSTDEQREGQTIQSQVDELRRFVDQKDWIIAETYKDEGWSGSLLGRPELDRLRDDAAKGLFNAVLVNDVDRLARDVAHLGVIKRDLERHGIAVIFRKLPHENTPTNNLLINMLGSFAEFERELIADRTRRGRLYKIESRQLFMGCIAPYGYRYVVKQQSESGEGDLTVLPSEAAVVREMYRWVDSEGLSAHQVVARLNEAKIAPRKGGSHWQRSSVLRILRSEVYAGVWHYNKHETRPRRTETASTAFPAKRLGPGLRRRPRSAWIPLCLPKELQIIERTQWERVQQQLDRNLSFSPRNSKHNYLLRSLIRCGACSAAYVGTPHHGRFFYRCGARCRKLPSVSEASLNTAVWDAVVTVALNPELVTRRLRDVLQSHRADTSRAAADEQQVTDLIAAIEAEETRIIEAYRMGFLSPEMLGRELAKLQARRSFVQTRQKVGASPDSDHTSIESAQDFLRLAAPLLSNFTAEERQRFLRLIVRSVIFEGDRVKIIGRIPSRGGLAPLSCTASRSTGNDEARNPRRTLNTSSIESLSCWLAPPAIGQLACARIATTEVGHCGRNAALEFELISAIDPTRPQQLRDEKTGRFVV